MTYSTPSETACACRPVIRERAHESVDIRIDPRASETARRLDGYADRYGDRLAEAITVGAIGRGPLAHRFSQLGIGSETFRHAQPGDVLIARGLFADSDPRVDIVGFDPKLDFDGLIESLDAPEAVELYRPAQGLADDQDVAPAAVAAGAIAVLKGLNSAADLRLKYEKINAINEANRQPSFTSDIVSLIDPRFRTGNEKTSVYRFYVTGKRKGTFYDSDDYKVGFDVTVLHDCINVLEARVTSRNGEARGLVLPYKMKVKVTKSTHSGHRLPPLARLHIAVTWNPDRASDWVGGDDASYRATGLLEIGADGRVKLEPGVRSDEVSISRLSVIRPSTAGCSAFYAKMGKGGGNTEPTQDFPPQNTGGRTHRPQRPRIAGPTAGTRPHPPHGRQIFFGFRSDNPRGYALQEVQRWWDGLPPAIKAAVVSGQRTLYLTGHADYTGGDRFNVALSQRRAEAVARLVRQVVGQSLDKKMRIDGKGWHQARQAGERRGRPNQNWRRVTISLDNPG